MNYEPRARRTKHQADRRDAASLRVTQKLKLNFTREKSRIAVQWGQDDQYLIGMSKKSESTMDYFKCSFWQIQNCHKARAIGETCAGAS